jgi:putative membrane protein insertion efficiency factor
VSVVQEQAAQGERGLPALRQRLSRPEFWLGLLLAVVVAAAIDASREPRDQLTARAWIGCVRLYQRIGRPLLQDVVHCRYVPTCSDYSIEAVALYGIAPGLEATVSRLARCTSTVPMGTDDPVATSVTTSQIIAGTEIQSIHNAGRCPEPRPFHVINGERVRRPIPQRENAIDIESFGISAAASGFATSPGRGPMRSITDPSAARSKP